MKVNHFICLKFLVIDQNAELSELILDLLERAFKAHNAELDEEKISGETMHLDYKRNDMIPALLNIAESLVMDRDRPIIESLLQTRHKILDRLLTIYTMD